MPQRLPAIRTVGLRPVAANGFGIYDCPPARIEPLRNVRTVAQRHLEPEPFMRRVEFVLRGKPIVRAEEKQPLQ